MQTCRSWRTIAVCLCGCALLCLILSARSAFAITPPRKSVLVVNEVGLAHPASSVVTQGLISNLSVDPSYQVEFYVESLDASSQDKAAEEQAEAALLARYSPRNVDVIVASGPASIRFMTRHATTFLPQVPVVICGATEQQATMIPAGGRFTGSRMRAEPAKTLAAAMRLLPATQHVFVVGGTSDFDRGVEAVTRTALQSMSNAVEVTYLTDLDMSALLGRLRELPPHSIVLYTSLFRDGRGNQFVNATTALPLVSDAANAPVFGMSDTYVGHGIVGGDVINFGEQGAIVANIVAQLFAGKRAQDIPITTASSVYMFDSRQLRRWGLNANRLPPGSLLLNHEPSLWERAKWIVLACALVILTLSCLLAYALYSRAQLKRARQEQMKLGGKLITAQEDERSRVASELHDDFSQRLALLSLGIETTADLVPESAEEAREQLNELLNSASELGADIHTLSHRLHSSTLERLGLVAGVNVFCKEFSAQHHINVAFSHERVSRSVPPDTALCLFRIVQEALRNVSKHSGASEAKVMLSEQDRGLQLIVADNGVGFNAVEQSRTQGLGLFSMEERARLVGARFEVHAEPGRGTRIQVWAPVRTVSPAPQESPARV